MCDFDPTVFTLVGSYDEEEKGKTEHCVFMETVASVGFQKMCRPRMAAQVSMQLLLMRVLSRAKTITLET